MGGMLLGLCLNAIQESQNHSDYYYYGYGYGESKEPSN